MSRSLIQVEDLRKIYATKGGFFGRRRVSTMVAVESASFEIGEGESVGVVGPSGSGKSTLARMILRLIEPDSGQVWFDGANIVGLSEKAMRSYRENMQIVFQDPLHSLNPRRTVAENVARPLLNFGWSWADAQKRVAEMLRLVELDPAHANRYPHEFSGGQCQRAAIARAIVLEPRFVVLDEPVSALDVSVQAQILNLLRRLQRELTLTYLFISHDLKLVRFFCDRMFVMYRGWLVEAGTSAAVYEDPMHPFTANFLQTVLHVTKDDRWQRAAQGADDTEDQASGLADEGKGEHPACIYAPTCPARFEPCTEVVPRLRGTESHRVACHLYDPRYAPNTEGS